MVSRPRTCLAGLVFLAMIYFSPMTPIAPVNAISCEQALAELLPCQAYLMGYGSITVPCCEGVKAVLQSVTSESDRKNICKCLKHVVLSANVNRERAKQLPQLCKIDVPAPIQLDIDCDE